jgi:hypothetical protein
MYCSPQVISGGLNTHALEHGSKNLSFNEALPERIRIYKSLKNIFLHIEFFMYMAYPFLPNTYLI